MSDTDPVEYSAEWWVKEILGQEKHLDEKFRNDGDKIYKRFLDERDGDDAIKAVVSTESRKYNVFWTNTIITKSALYATPPAPLVKREWDDAKDDVGRTAALILQRILSFDLNRQNSSSHAAFEKAVDDRLIPGLGQIWLALDVKTAPISLPEERDPLTGAVIAEAMEGQRIVSQKVRYDYVNWRDFVWGPGRTWEEVPWVARRIWMRKKAFVEKFGEAKYKEIKEYCETGVTREGMPRGFKKGNVEIYEVWDKDSGKVYFVHIGSKDFCAEPKDDPLKLDGFFPCPEPLLATHSTSSLVPRADYVMIADQYEELDNLNDRISTLTRALRVVGMYDGANTDLAKLLSGPEMQMIPVSNWAALGEQGGLKGAVDWFPVEVIAAVLEKLVQQRINVVQQIYELTGISDIMRGASNPRDTLGAQKLKAQYSSVRLRLTQQSVAEFVCNSMRIATEIMCRHFEPEQLIQQSKIDLTESAQLAQPAIQLLKNYQEAEYRVEVTEESLSMADYTAEREMRVAYLTAVGQFLSQAGQMVAGMPAALPYLIRIILWVTASFRGSDDVETVLDEAANMALNAPPPAPPGPPQEPPGPNPLEVEQVKTQGKIQQQTNEKNLQLRNDIVTARLANAGAQNGDNPRTVG